MAGRFSVDTVFRGKDETTGVISAIQAKARAAAKDFHPGDQMSHVADKGVEGFKMIGAAAAVAGAAGGVALEHIIETGANFEHSITGVGAVMGKSRAQIEDLEKAAMSLGVTTVFSASEVSEAMEQMARKGFDSEEILKGIGGTLDAVAASGEGMAEVSSIVGSSIRGFGLEAKDATHVADVLAFTSEKVGAKITDLGTALATAAPTASALGVSIEDTAAAVGLLQKMGIDSSTAGSATATMLAKISKPSKDARQQMAAMGISFKDAAGNMLPLRDVIGQFVKAGDKAGGNMNKMAFFAELVGLRGDKAALGLEHMVKSGDFDKLTEGLSHVDGYAHKVASLKLDDTTGSWKLLGSTIEVLEIKLFKLSGGGLKSAIDKTNEWVAANQDLIVDKVSGFAETLTNDVKFLADNIGTGVRMLGNFKDGVHDAFEDSTMVQAFGGALGKIFGNGGKTSPSIQAYILGERIGDLTIAVGGFVIVTKAAQAAVWLFGAAAKGAQAVTWLWNAAVAATRWVIGSYGVAAEVGAANTVALGESMTAATIGAGEMAAAEEVATTATVELETAAGGAAAAVEGIGAAAGVALGPLTALVAAATALAGYEGYKFAQENGGMEGVKGFLGIGGRKGGFEGVDDAMNQQARQQAELRDAQEAEDARRAAIADAQHAAVYSHGGAAYDAVAGFSQPAANGYANAFGFGTQAGGGVAAPAAKSSEPQVVSLQEQSTAQLGQHITRGIGDALRGKITIEIKDKDKKSSVTTSGSDIMSIDPSGSF